MTDVALFMNALRAAVPAEPDPGLGADLVPRLAATARASTIGAETAGMRSRSAQRSGAPRRRRSRLTSVARVAIAIALIPLVLAGLAVAGVTLPSPARSAFDSIGVTLPNQPPQDSAAGGSKKSSQPAAKGTAGPDKSGKSTPENRGESTTAHEHARSQRIEAEGNAIGHTRGKAIGLKELTPPGLSGEMGPPAHETGPPAHSNAGGSSNSQANSRAYPPHPTPVPSNNATDQTTTLQDQAVVGQ
jgi:hypothetical protein